MSLFSKTLVMVLGVFVAATTLPAAASQTVTFHFYGAEDCAPCVAFKRNHLEDVRAQGKEAGFGVSANMIHSTRDVGDIGIYGEADPLLRRAGEQMNRVYPPMFFVTRGDDIVNVTGRNWREALAAAMEEAN